MKRLARGAILLLLCFLLPLGANAAEILVPVGKIVGLQLKSDTVVIAAFDDRLGKNAKAAGLRVGDEILQINGKQVKDAQDVRDALEKCNENLEITVERNGKTIRCKVTPEQSAQGARLGVYLKQGISGIGTVTWYDPKTETFGVLGHGVNTGRGNLLKMTGGTVYDAEILSVKKGKSGNPGQLRGSADGETPRGKLMRNTPQGVFGKVNQCWQGEPLPTAKWEEISTGSAKILSTVDGDIPREYSVEIVRLYAVNRADGRNLMLRVTDPDLLDATGGIVQGMSGSPILQNGRIVGAVTHVLVNDPTMGYGIFIGNMLDAAG